MCKEIPISPNNAVLERSLRMASTSSNLTMEFSLESFRSLGMVALNIDDLYEPLPLKITGRSDVGRDSGPSFPSFISLASEKLDSLPEIEDDAILFDRLAEVCNLGGTVCSAKRAPSLEVACPLQEPRLKKQRQIVDPDSEDETSPRFR